MIYVVHIVKEIKPLSCNWMDYVSLKKIKWRVFIKALLNIDLLNFVLTSVLLVINVVHFLCLPAALEFLENK